LSKKKRKKVRRGEAAGSRGARRVDRTEIVKAAGVPQGSRFKGYADFDVQELVISTQRTRYRLEKWLTPDGRLVTASLPPGTNTGGGHFGDTLRCFVMYQYYHAMVTEPLLLRMSTSQLKSA
jgi:hypothetical protein